MGTTTRLKTLRRLESTLERFLERAVATEEGILEIEKGIESLDEIARDSLQGRSVNNRLGSWFAHHNRLVESGQVSEGRREEIANLLGAIRSGLDGNDSEGQRLADEIDRWKEKGIVPKRKLVLKMKPPVIEESIADRFFQTVAKEKEFLEYGRDGSDHLLSVLEDVLKSAEAKEDPMYLHLAGSIIYFLKINGYKVEPFVKRLKVLEQNKKGLFDVT